MTRADLADATGARCRADSPARSRCLFVIGPRPEVWWREVVATFGVNAMSRRVEAIDADRRERCGS